jgi:dGTPase
LEGRIVRVADRIAYLCHDYDDSLRAGLLTPGDLPAEIYKGLGESTSQMITTMVEDMIVSSEGQGDILQSARIKGLMDVFREFMFKNIYHSDMLSRERRQAAFVLRELYHYFMENFLELPPEYIGREECWGRQKVVTDYVAGLTDSYAVELFNDIFMPPVGQPAGLAKNKKGY